MMDRLFEERINKLIATSQEDSLSKIAVGLERESLRVTHEGIVSEKNHPASLGSSLTHPSITTDYAEALLEFVTSPCLSPEKARDELLQKMAFAARRLGDEWLWSASMPCALSGEESIRIAEYGNSNLGKLKHLYRVGLAHRYGKTMQMIAGVHFNFSFRDEAWQVFAAIDGVEDTPDYRSKRYLDLTRNIKRAEYVVPYLFGASPAMDNSFFNGAHDALKPFDDRTRYLPSGTALRLSDLGYSNRKCRAVIPFNTLSGHLNAIERALSTPCPTFIQIGTEYNGERKQLNTNMLQIEAEHYAGVRVKRAPKHGETMRHALRERGIAYVEMRLLDVSPFDITGVSLDTLRFIEAWLTTCFLMDSPLINADECAAAESIKLRVALEGRNKDLTLHLPSYPKATLQDALYFLLNAMSPVCEILGQDYINILEKARASVRDSEMLPSARLLKEMRDNQESFQDLGLRYARQHTDTLKATPISPDDERAMVEEATQSLIAEKALALSDTVSFDAYLEQVA